LGRSADGAEVELELLLLPLAFDGRSRVRALGALVALAPPYWLGEQPVIELELRTLRHLGAEQCDIGAPRFGEVGEPSHTRHGFVVYQGGRGLPAGKRTG